MSTAQNAVTAEPGNGSATIRARVGASAIDKVTRLFSAGLADIFTETLQNSRRGGANRVAATIEQDGDTTRVTLADDGVGIADPAVLLTFGESAWKDGIAEDEDPAGFGLLALSRRGCTLRWRVPGQDPSPGCRLVLEPAHFLGRDAAHVVPDDSAPWPHGMPPRKPRRSSPGRWATKPTSRTLRIWDLCGTIRSTRTRWPTGRGSRARRSPRTLRWNARGGTTSTGWASPDRGSVRSGGRGRREHKATRRGLLLRKPLELSTRNPIAVNTAPAYTAPRVERGVLRGAL